MTWQIATGALVGALLGYGGGRLAPRWLERSPMKAWEPFVLAAVTAVLAGYLAVGHPLDLYFWQHVIFVGILATASLVDLHDRIIPNELVIAGLIAGVIAVFAAPYAGRTWLDGLLGMVAAFALFLLLALLVKGGMGMGDVKLSAVIGLFLGIRWVAMGLILAFLAGGVVSIFLLIGRAVGRKDYIPFGPWLAVGAIVTAIWGLAIWVWYMGIY